jgi:signal peptidase I
MGALSVVILRVVIPSSLEGAHGGVAGVLGSLAEVHPLVLGVSIFVVLLELGRYWLRRWGIAVDTIDGKATSGTKKTFRRTCVALVLVALAAFLTRSSLIAAYRVVGPSMLPTLEIGDRVLVDRTAYGFRLPFSTSRLAARVPSRGDLVVFRAGSETVVRRVAGIPGDRISRSGGGMVINESAVGGCDAGAYAALTGAFTTHGRLFVEVLGAQAHLTVRAPAEPRSESTTVGPGEVYVVGDNRGRSNDPSAQNEGRGTVVPIEALEGRLTRLLVGARPDGRLDFSRLLARANELRVRQPGLDMTLTDQRIARCVR